MREISEEFELVLEIVLSCFLIELSDKEDRFLIASLIEDQFDLVFLPFCLKVFVLQVAKFHKCLPRFQILTVEKSQIYQKTEGRGLTASTVILHPPNLTSKLTTIFPSVSLSQRHPEGIATITMADAEEADLLIQVMHNRFFGQRKLSAETWDGKTKYK
jgi:hypothetical protein